MTTKCTYSPCFNLKAVEEELYHETIEQPIRMEKLDYYVHLDELVVSLDPIHTYCYHERV